MIQDFQLENALGKGFTAEVYQASRPGDNTKYAVKVFNETESPEECRLLIKNEIDCA